MVYDNKLKQVSKVAVFIDNSNVFKIIQYLRKSDPKWISLYDPLKLAEKLVGNRNLAYVGFYCVQPPSYLLGEDEWHIKIYKITQKYYSEIEKMPLVHVKYGNLRGPKGSLQEKNVDTQLATDMVAMAATGAYNTAIIVSNDGDYESAVNLVKNTFGKKVEVVFFKGRLSMNLEKSCDVKRRARRSFFELLDFDKNTF
ncbi:NYN domain-containing protein [Patescibacteria group bacterium]|nr:NYN domain-containing protein [Patescibacteria group bacterium]MBU4458315.1 NYN domain-containing protein [Patescibacteria group bacterium]MCG2695930.1 NYN domain-containing protein [Candidatus Portnoybacteria bacterium]